MTAQAEQRSWVRHVLDAVLVPLTSWWNLFAECIGAYASGALLGSAASVLLRFGLHLLDRPWDPTLLVCAGAHTLATRRRLSPVVAATAGPVAALAVQGILLAQSVDSPPTFGGGGLLDMPFTDRAYILSVVLPGVLVAAAWIALRASRPDLFPESSRHS